MDGAQAAGAIPLRVAELGVDFYAIPGQKWLLGPEGTGALWASPGVTERSLVSTGSWFTYEEIGVDRAVPRPDARRFDDGGPYRPGDHRSRPELRLAVDVRRAAVDPRARPGAWPGPRPTASRRSTAWSC